MPEVSSVGEFIIIKFDKAFSNVETVNNFIDNTSGESNTKYFLKEFRWSVDNLTYGGWIEMIQDNLQALVIDHTKPFWIQFKYTVDGTQDTVPLSVSAITLDITYNATSKLANFSPNCHSCECNSDPIVFDCGIPFNPYMVNNAANIAKQLSLMVNNTFGVEVEYFRSVPQERSKDVVLKEWTLYNADPGKCIKVVVPDNKFPDSKINYNLMGMDFEVPFEVHIDKVYFESMFGKGTLPQRKDVVFIPMQNRIYQVSGSYIFKDFMGEPLYHIVALVKYTPSSNVIQDQELEDAFDKITVSTDELFQEEINNEILRITKPEHYTISTLDQDPNRELFNKDLVLVEENINNNFTLVSHYNYKLSSLIGLENNSIAVKYHAKNKWESVENRSFTCWFQKTEQPQTPTKFVTNVLDNGNGTFTITTNVNHKFKVGDEIMFALSNTNEVNTFKITIVPTEDTLTFAWPHSILPKNGWYLYLANLNHIISAYDSTNPIGMIFEQAGNKMFRVVLNDKKYIFTLPFVLQEDKWYAMTLNMSNIHKEISLYLWEIDPSTTNKTTKLKILYSATKVMETVVIDGPQFILKPANLKITNLRLFRDIIEPEKQSNILNQHIIKDTHLTILVDNCVPTLNLPQVTKKY